MSFTKRPANRLLAALPAKVRSDITPHLEEWELRYKEVVYEPGARIRHVIFPESGIVSLLASVETQTTLEVGIVGREGLVGLPVFLGEKVSDTLCLVQGEGTGLRIATRPCLELFARHEEFRKVVTRFTGSLMRQISQSAACNRFHTAEARFARWLLMSHDRMRTDEFQITQDFLANMIGVRREAVNGIARQMQRAKIINYRHGTLAILNRRKLEAQACTCYQIITK